MFKEEKSVFDRKKARFICQKLLGISPDWRGRSNAAIVVAADMLPSALAEIDRQKEQIQKLVEQAREDGENLERKKELIRVQAAKIAELTTQNENLMKNYNSLRSRSQSVETSLTFALKALVEERVNLLTRGVGEQPITPKEYLIAEARRQLSREYPRFAEIFDKIKIE